jgi:hypothetical protein
VNDQRHKTDMANDIPKSIQDGYSKALDPLFNETRALVSSRVRAHLERLSLSTDAHLVESITDTVLPDLVAMILRDQVSNLRNRVTNRGG